MSDLTELQRETVDRIKARRRVPQVVGARIGGAVSAARTACSRARVAARYAFLFQTSLSEAARVVGINQTTVNEAWHRMYPGVPALRGRRSP